MSDVMAYPIVYPSSRSPPFPAGVPSRRPESGPRRGRVSLVPVVSIVRAAAHHQPHPQRGPGGGTAQACGPGMGGGCVFDYGGGGGGGCGARLRYARAAPADGCSTNFYCRRCEGAIGHPLHPPPRPTMSLHGLPGLLQVPAAQQSKVYMCPTSCRAQCEPCCMCGWAEEHNGRDCLVGTAATGHERNWWRRPFYRYTKAKGMSDDILCDLFSPGRFADLRDTIKRAEKDASMCVPSSLEERGRNVLGLPSPPRRFPCVRWLLEQGHPREEAAMKLVL